MSDTTNEILASLRKNVERWETHADGSKWGCVYLDNAIPDGMSFHAFAGYLSALKKQGLYRPEDDDGCFGLVRLG